METVICCFCAQAIQGDLATTLAVFPPGTSDESQALYCHGACLSSRLDPSIPVHPLIDEE